jgi:hypothetical protein
MYVLLFLGTWQIASAQTAADYYLPLCLDNYLKFETPDNPDGWAGRTSFLSIIREDEISGQTYYLEEGIEIPYGTTDTVPYRYIWLREDVAGNIIIGAFGEIPDIDSATILPGVYFFSNEFLNSGYISTSSLDDSTEISFEVLSVTATAGAYSNCIQVRETVLVNGIAEKIDDRYYAYGIGQVQGVRLLPIEEQHTASLVEYLAETCSATALSEIGLQKEVPVVYPIPANDLLTIDMALTIENEGAVFQLLNTQGKVVWNKIIQSGKTEIPVDQLPAGIYLYQINSSGNQSYGGKIVIE